MACNKSFVALLLCLVVLSATTAVLGEDSLYSMVDNSCFCHCMIEECMASPGANKELCATTCDDKCHKTGLSGRIDKDDFCGY